MKDATIVLLLVLCAGLILASTMHGQDIARAYKLEATRHFPQKPHSPIPLALRPHDPRPPATASPDILWVQCPAEAEMLGAICGYVPVPLDRQHPSRAKIRIYFELYVHTNPGPAQSAIMANPEDQAIRRLASASWDFFCSGKISMCTTSWGSMTEVVGCQAPLSVRSCNTVLSLSATPKRTVPLNWETPPASTVPVTLPWTLTRFVQLSATTKWTISQGLTGEKT